MRDTLDWNSLRLDGIAPGMLSSDVLLMDEWHLSEGVLCSKSYGDLSIGFPFSNADVVDGRIEAVAGKRLTLAGEVLAEVGQSWKSLLEVLAISSGSLRSDKEKLGLGAANYEGVLGMIRLYRLRS